MQNIDNRKKNHLGTVSRIHVDMGGWGLSRYHSREICPYLLTQLQALIQCKQKEKRKETVLSQNRPVFETTDRSKAVVLILVLILLFVTS